MAYYTTIFTVELVNIILLFQNYLKQQKIFILVAIIIFSHLIIIYFYFSF